MSNTTIQAHEVIITRRGLHLKVETPDSSHEHTFTNLNEMLQESVELTRKFRKQGYYIKLVNDQPD